MSLHGLQKNRFRGTLGWRKEGNSLTQRIKFFTDSTCDLPSEICAQKNITQLPLHVILGDEDHLDGVTVTRQELFDYSKKTKTLPKTAAVGIVDFLTAFKQAFDEGYTDVIYTGISEKISTTFNNARLARDEAEKSGIDPSRIHLVSSLQLSTGTAQLLWRGVDLANQGMDAETIVNTLNGYVPRLRTSFVVDTLEYLHMGGRCSSVAYVAGSMLKLHPMIVMKDGSMSVGDKYRGTIEHCLKLYQKKVVLDVLDTIVPDLIFVTHTCEDPHLAETAKAELDALNYFKHVQITMAGATISSHCGPNTLGYLYLVKE